jgi:predicted transcriptional regulator of viral defense system
MRQDPQTLRRRLSQLAGERGGYFSAAEALSAGYSYPAQHYHQKRGDWTRVERGIYRLPEWPEAAHADLVRWTLWSRDQAVISHETAIAVHELGDIMSALIHLTVPAAFGTRAPSTAVVHRAELPPGDVETRVGFRVTDPERSILDVASTMEIDRLARVIEEAIKRGLTSPARLRQRSDEFGVEAALGIERALRQVGS